MEITNKIFYYRWLYNHNASSSVISYNRLVVVVDSSLKVGVRTVIIIINRYSINYYQDNNYIIL